jgi:hypothetical protein
LRDCSREEQRERIARCCAWRRRTPSIGKPEESARALNKEMSRLQRGTNAYWHVERERRATAQTSAAISEPHLAADPAFVKIAQAKAMAESGQRGGYDGAKRKRARGCTWRSTYWVTCCRYT